MRLHAAEQARVDVDLAPSAEGESVTLADEAASHFEIPDAILEASVHGAAPFSSRDPLWSARSPRSERRTTRPREGSRRGHGRHGVAIHIFGIEGGSVYWFDGNYSEYEEDVRMRIRARTGSARHLDFSPAR